MVIGERPGFDAPATDVAAFNVDSRAQLQVGCALFAMSAPFFVWFLASVVAPARESRAAAVAFGCGLVFAALLVVDATALSVAALRPRSPDLAVTLLDVEFLAMGAATPAVAGMLAACSVVVGGRLGRLALVAAAAYLLRLGTLFTTDGAFASDGVLGLWLPVVALAGWVAAASLGSSRPGD